MSIKNKRFWVEKTPKGLNQKVKKTKIKKMNKQKTFVTFMLQNELFAINVNKVLEIILEYKIVEVPDAPKYIKGMLNFRSEIIPVVDFREKFKFVKSKNNQNKIIVIEINIDNNSIKFGAIVDKVKDVLRVKEEDINLKPEFGSKYNPEYLNGVIFNNNNFYLLLNIEKVFTDKEIKIIKKNNNSK